MRHLFSLMHTPEIKNGTATLMYDRNQPIYMKRKHLLTGLLAILLSLPGMAQMKRLMVLENFEQAIMLRDSLKTFYNGQYDLSYFNYNKKDNDTRMVFSNSEDRKIEFFISARRIGEDKVLEKEGIQVIERVHVKGRFLDLFNLYKRFIDPAAELEKLKDKGLDRGKTYKAYPTDNGLMFVNLFGSGENWELIVAINNRNK